MTNKSAEILTGIVQNERGKLLTYIRSKLSSLEEAEDLLQDVLTYLAGNLNVLERIDNLTGWLYTVVNNRIIDRYRRRKLTTVSIDAPLENGLGLAELLAEELPEPIDEVEAELVYESVIDCIDMLPEKQKQVIVEQVLNGKTFRELAEASGEPINTWIARKRYAIQTLRQQLTEIREMYYEE